MLWNTKVSPELCSLFARMAEVHPFSTGCGSPSIRTDIPKYDKRSVADTQSYGDDVNANYLLRPTLFSSFGLEEDEFVKPRSKDYLKRLFNSCGLNMEDHTFEEIYSQVSEGKNVASIESFQIAYEERQQIQCPDVPP